MKSCIKTTTVANFSLKTDFHLYVHGTILEAGDPVPIKENGSKMYRAGYEAELRFRLTTCWCFLIPLG